MNHPCAFLECPAAGHWTQSVLVCAQLPRVVLVQGDLLQPERQPVAGLPAQQELLHVLQKTKAKNKISISLGLFFAYRKNRKWEKLFIFSPSNYNLIFLAKNCLVIPSMLETKMQFFKNLNSQNTH